MSQSGYSIHNLVEEAKTRWLKPAEIFFILQNYTEDQITHTPPQKPAAGSLFLFNKRVLRFFRKDGHSWRKKKDGKTVGEAHERLKVGNSEALNCYYAHGEQNPNFQRRSFWMLDPAFEHIVLVHYRDISEGRPSSGSVSKLSTGSPSTFSQSQSFYTAPDPGSTTVITEYQSPESVEVNSEAVFKGNGIDCTGRMERNEETSSSCELEVSQALRRLEVQLSLNDDSFEEVGQFCSLNEDSSNSEYIFSDQCRSATSQENLNSLLLQRSDDSRKHDNQGFGQQLTMDPKGCLSWKDMLEVNTSSPGAESQENDLHPNGNGMVLSHSKNYLLEEQERRRWTNFDGHSGQEYNDFGTADNNSTQKIEASNISLSMFEVPLSSQVTSLVPGEVEDFKFPAYSPSTSLQHNHPYYTTLFDESRNGMYPEAGTSLTIAQKQKFTIREICPEWSFSTESTKVVIVGSFLCDPSQGEWTCMFGDIEVPLQIIQEGVLCCSTPLHLPGKVTLCITSGNRESCSEVREFEYRVKPSNYDQCSSSQQERTKSPEELLLLVRLVQMLLTDPPINKRVPAESGQDLLGMSKSDDDSWGHVIEALLVGNWTSSTTTDWILQELLKDKLQQWLLSRAIVGGYQPDCSLSKREQSVIHMIAGLGFEWALNPILNAGVSINFRDINGWTALHWAAQFGREQMVAALIASGASAGAVTDPNTQDLMGRTPASIAAARGHKGLAGYLSEAALTSHLTSLTLEVNELSKGSADVEAEFAVNSISRRSLAPNEDNLSLKDTLAAVRNAAQAAARIQAAFRAHSFRRRQFSEAASDAGSVDEYGILPHDIQGLSVTSKMAFRNPRDYNKAALSIQKKFRGWKGRKDFLALRHKVVKIQAHIRGHQVRKQYKVICWAVGVLEKVVLRWRRKRSGLRGFQPDSELIDQNEDGDILKVFRKKKVDGAIDEAVSQVFSMVDSPDARQQYCRVLGRYRQAKAELYGEESSEVTPNFQNEVCFMDNEDTYQYFVANS